MCEIKKKINKYLIIGIYRRMFHETSSNWENVELKLFINVGLLFGIVLHEDRVHKLCFS